MINVFMSTMIFLMVAMVFIYPFATMAIKVSRGMLAIGAKKRMKKVKKAGGGTETVMDTSTPKLPMLDNILAFIPFNNIAMTRKAFGYSTVPVYVAGGVAYALFLFRLVAIFILYENPWIMLISIYTNIFMIIVTIAVHAWVLMQTAIALQQTLFTKICCIIVQPLAALIIGSNAIRELREAEEDLKDTFGKGEAAVHG